MLLSSSTSNQLPAHTPSKDSDLISINILPAQGVVDDRCQYLLPVRAEKQAPQSDGSTVDLLWTELSVVKHKLSNLGRHVINNT